MNKLQKFNNSEFGELRVIEIDGKPYFPATACAKKLGYDHPENAIKRHCRYSLKRGVPHPQNPEKTVEMNFIPESDLYRLIIHSRLPAAERFEKWVFEEVLPTIRKSGGYAPDIEKLVQTAVKAAMAEVMRVQPCGHTPQSEAEHKRQRLCGYRAGIVANLDAPIRQEIDLMLESHKYTYRDICQMLERDYGIHVSKSAMGRYAQQVMDVPPRPIQEETTHYVMIPVTGLIPRNR